MPGGKHGGDGTEYILCSVLMFPEPKEGIRTGSEELSRLRYPHRLEKSPEMGLYTQIIPFSTRKDNENIISRCKRERDVVGRRKEDLKGQQ